MPANPFDFICYSFNALMVIIPLGVVLWVYLYRRNKIGPEAALKQVPHDLIIAGLFIVLLFIAMQIADLPEPVPTLFFSAIMLGMTTRLLYYAVTLSERQKKAGALLLNCGRDHTWGLLALANLVVIGMLGYLILFESGSPTFILIIIILINLNPLFVAVVPLKITEKGILTFTHMLPWEEITGYEWKDNLLTLIVYYKSRWPAFLQIVRPRIQRMVTPEIKAQLDPILKARLPSKEEVQNA